jgi:hypothetical protein
MEKLTNNHFNFSNKEQAGNLSQVAKDLSVEDTIDLKQFSTIDLWRIQNKYKTMLNKRNH